MPAPMRVLARGSGGRWLKFSEEFRARAHLLKESHPNIVTCAQAFGVRYATELTYIYDHLTPQEKEAVQRHLPPPKPVPQAKKSKKKIDFKVNGTEHYPIPSDTLAHALFEGLLETAYDVYSIYARTAEEAALTGKRPPRKKDGIYYEVVYDPSNKKHAEKFDALPRQAKLCLTTLLAKQKEGIDLNQVDCEKFINEIKVELKTKQDPWRVFKFYQTKLVSLDLLRVRSGT